MALRSHHMEKLNLQAGENSYAIEGADKYYSRMMAVQ